MSSKEAMSILIGFIVISVVFLAGCIEDKKTDNISDDEDNRQVYNATISLQPPFGRMENPNFAMDEGDNIHFIWINDPYREMRFFSELKYSKYSVDMEPIILNQTILSGNDIASSESSKIPMFFDSGGNLHTLVDRSANYEIDGVHYGSDMVYIKIGPDGKFLNRTIPRNVQNIYPDGVKHITSRSPRMVMDSNDDLHLVWWGWDKLTEGRYVDPINDIHYMKLDANGEVLIAETKVTHDNVNRNEYPFLNIDEEDGLHLVWTKDLDDGDDEIYYVKLDGSGDTLKINNGPMKIGTGYKGDSDQSRLFQDKYMIIWREALTEKPMMTRIDLEGNIISTDVMDLQDIFQKDERKNMILFGFEGWSCGKEDVVINMTMYDPQGNLEIHNKTVLVILRNPMYDHGPSVFNFQHQVDSTGDIHVCYYVNDGHNGFQFHHLLFNSKGDRVAPVFVVAP